MAETDYAKRRRQLAEIDEQIKERQRKGKSTNNLNRTRRLIEQSDPSKPIQYGKKGGVGLTGRVQKKVRHTAGVSNVLRLPEGSVWHHIIESQTGKKLFTGLKNINDIKKLNKVIDQTGMILGNAFGAVEELPERLHKGGKSTSLYAEDIHNWVTKNTPKNASWNKLTASSSLDDRIKAAKDMGKFFHQSKQQIQKLQFAQYQLGGIVDKKLGINAPGQASKTVLQGNTLKPGWHGNFTDMIKNPVDPSRSRAYAKDFAKIFGYEGLSQQLKQLPKIKPAAIAKGGLSALKKSGGHPLRLVAGELIDRAMRATLMPQAERAGQALGRALKPVGRKIDDVIAVSKNPQLRDKQIDNLLRKLQWEDEIGILKRSIRDFKIN